ncbi:right-handed parallel beta-helix repeat-containing protein [Rugosimonospora acidiphila]|uniref:right-handed parallel beta-helix repeat-containing protein n=1 Tax=Rugosimonospora acidiphila TaxID=556531 RepID=UPI0031E805E9
MNVEDVWVWDTASSVPAVSVVDSSHVLFDGGQILSDDVGVLVSASSGSVTVQHADITGATGVEVDPGVSGAIISTNIISGYSVGGGVAVVGATGTAVVSNTIDDVCTSGIGVRAAATATILENNVVQNQNGGSCAATAESVTADAVAGTTQNYEEIFPVHGSAVEWAGATYPTVAAFQAATGLGPHDVGVAGQPEEGWDTDPGIDSADAQAPGELPTDVLGNPRVDNPHVSNSGTGVGYFDRGAWEFGDPFNTSIGATPLGALTASVGFENPGDGAWGATYTGTLDWGDGTQESITASRLNPQISVKEHTYTKPGTYTLSFSLSDGYVTRSSATSVTLDGSDYVAYGPTRLMDTRTGLGVGKIAKIGPAGDIALKVAGAGTAGNTIPSTAKAVVLNLTATNPTQASYFSAYPGGTPRPLVSNLDFPAGTTTAGAVIVPMGTDGTVHFYNHSGSTDLIVDVSGYFVQTPADGYTPLTPHRLLDTRDGAGGNAGPVGAGATRALQITGAGDGSLPDAGIDAVVLNLTTTDVTESTFVTAYPEGSPRPLTSNIDVDPRQTRANAVTVPVGADGKIDLYNNSGSVDLIADVVGYYSTSGASAYVPLTPGRILDTRPDATLPPYGTTSSWPTPPPPSSSTPTAWVLNATVTDTTATGYLTAYPDGVARPTASTLDWTAGATVSNLVVAESDGGAIDLYNGSSGGTDLLLDEFGYFANN